MIDYDIFYKTTLPLSSPWPAENRWDLFISTYTSANRVQQVFDMANADMKYWLVAPEYGYEEHELPSDRTYVNVTHDESEYIKSFWHAVGNLTQAALCIDITGFIRPHLIFLVRWLMEQGVSKFDAIYSEPVHYSKRERTQFSDEAVTEVRQVAGFEGTHSTDTSNDVLIIGAGYDHQLIAAVAENKDNARKVQLFGLPSLRADMYQENVLRAHRAAEAVGAHTGDEATSYFAPANDPFVTASVLRAIVKRIEAHRQITNLYLSPLATKPQVLGFVTYFLTECIGRPASLIFPFCRSYSQETSKGISRIWKYTVELPQT